MKALHEEAQEATKALRELWQATGIEPIIIWILDRLTQFNIKQLLDKEDRRWD